MKAKLLIATVLFRSCMFLAPTAGGQTPDATSPPPFPPPCQFGSPDLAQMLTQMLSLSDAQKAQVQPLAQAVQPQLDTIHKQARDSGEAILKQLSAQIRPLLTTAQQTKLDSLDALRSAAPGREPQP